MKSIIAVILSASLLSACAVQQPVPVVDMKGVSPEQQARFSVDLQECRVITANAMQSEAFNLLISSNLTAARNRFDDKEAGILRNCLTGRGHNILY